MEQISEIRIPKHVLKIMNYLEATGFEAFVVGGCVRDCIQGTIPKDWDVCTSASPNQMKGVFEGILPLIPTGEKHGTMTVLSDGIPIEVTSFRCDGSYSNGRHPESVCFVPSIDEDLARRDFTVNAMAYNTRTGLVDLYGGLSDIVSKTLRCVGEPKLRFKEDALRIMRALRFSAVCSLKIENETDRAIHECKELLSKISAERIFNELRKILVSDKPSEILIAYRDVFEVILPKIFCVENFKEEYSHLADKMPKNDSMRLAAILGNADTDDAKHSLSLLKTDKLTRRNVCMLLENADINPPTDDASAKYMLKKFGEADTISILTFAMIKNEVLGNINFAFKESLSLVKKIIKNGDCYSVKALDIDGSDLITLGAAEGIEIGKKLECLLDAVIEGKVENRRDELIKFVTDNK